MNEKPLYIASCSFGKDSVATILLALENNEPLDRVVFVEVMFDHERGISGEDPTHIEWVHSVAIPKLEAMGVKVDVVKSDADYIGWATQPIAKTSQPDRIGKKRVWLLQGRCALNRDGKLKAIFISILLTEDIHAPAVAADYPYRPSDVDTAECL
jgi:hypothetical protein